MHLPGQWAGGEDNTHAWPLNHDNLKIDLGKENDKEPPVVEESSEHVELSSRGFVVLIFSKNNRVNDSILSNLWWHSSQNSAIDHVEELHHHENLEE